MSIDVGGSMYKRILVPTDGSEISTKAIQTACGMAKLMGSTLFLVSVKEPFPYSAISEMQPVPPQEFYDAQDRLASGWIQAGLTLAKNEGIACEGSTVEAVHPWEAIIEEAKTHACDLIVMASHGRRGLTALLLGSETTRVLTHSPLPVLVVR
jgi:nucleotide-binding universal stress UspA family protein